MPSDWCVVGLTPARTARGLDHVDGAACAITADDCVAIAEERVARMAHAGGSELALRAVLRAVGRKPADVGRWVLSTCGEPADRAPGERSLGTKLHASLRDLGVEANRIFWSPSHHLSHAYTAATLAESGDLIAVVDDAGSEAMPGQVERASIYELDEAGRLHRIAAVDAPSPGGLGTLYRIATSQLGFRGETECGKTMALAAYGTPLSVPGSLVGINPMLAAAEASQSIDSVLAVAAKPRWTFRGLSWGDAHVAVAKAVQEAVERGLSTWLTSVLTSRTTPPKRIVLAGGVALNCRAMGRLASELPVEIVVHHAPGDTGQALGNALIAVAQFGRQVPRSAASPFLGPPPTTPQVELAIRMSAVGAVQWLDRVSAADVLANWLAQGEVIGLFEGRSEYGPRALGHRSILADPRSPHRAAQLNSQKEREPFRPFGLAVRAYEVTWLTGFPLSSPAMLLAVKALPEAAARVPAGIHVDGTTRVQTVDRETGLIHDILGSWRILTGTPTLLNTSFNCGGEPIVETPSEAIDSGHRLGLDAVALVAGSRIAIVRFAARDNQS
jgi:carbamoyltransferase